MSLSKRSIRLPLLQAYKAKFGDLKIIKGYVVPSTIDWPEEFHGFKLGNYVTFLRKKLKKQPSMSEDIKELLKMGFIVDPHAERKQMLLTAFNSYRRLYPHSLIPNTFKVPSDNQWPEDTHKLPLGLIFFGIRKLRTHPELHESLTALGFDISKPTRIVRNFDRVYKALETYKSIHGHLKIPQSYVIANDDENYPENSRGMHLGEQYSHIRNGTFDKHKDKLIALGVNFEIKSYLTRVGLDVLTSSFLAYKNIHKSTAIPRSFVVPVDSRFPERTWGCNLGDVVCNLRESKAINHAKLFNVRVKTHKRLDSYFEVIFDSLLAYKRTYGDLNVKFSFVIPDKSTDFPIHTWGLELGKTVHRIRKGAFAAQKERLLNIGFSYKRRKANCFETLFSALQAYSIIHGNVNIPAKYTIPNNSDQYPEKTWGMNLGYSCQSIKKGAYSKHRDKLIEIGFKLK